MTALAVAGSLTLGQRAHSTPAALTASSPAATSASVASAPVVLSATDGAFLQLMIPINESALTFFSVVQTVADAPALRDLAARAASTHRVELEEMRALLAAGGVAEQNIHEGHRMPGMIFDDQLAELRAAPPGNRDARITELLQGHLKQSSVVATGEENAGGSDEVKAFAARLKQLRSEQLTELGAISSTP
ncbi:DUF305 domain-containing protein [Micromonospora sp. CB01531]|uniref:DUF305 domain-containing protein n=1 Tax=Micromonospora sp. CB01531 TaxID=1718947 RepID=UPI001300D558|nr:DUF305 domain-containing protein [Micromonospora sp. CB01531]